MARTKDCIELIFVSRFESANASRVIQRVRPARPSNTREGSWCQRGVPKKIILWKIGGKNL